MKTQHYHNWYKEIKKSNYEEQLFELYMYFEQYCMTCTYWNKCKDKPKCWATKGDAVYGAKGCDYLSEPEVSDPESDE